MPLNCDDVRERLADFAAGDLDPADRAALAQHLAACPGCARAANRTAAILEVARGVEAPALSADFADRTMARVRRRARTARLVRSGWRTAAVAASLLVGLALLLVFSRARRPHRIHRESAHLEAVVSGVGAAFRETGGPGRQVLGAVVEAGREALETAPTELAAVAPDALETAIAGELEGLDGDLDALGRAILGFVEDVRRSVPWL